jgi:archaellum component FlaF (FlaF/FlaG flagellin family)
MGSPLQQQDNIRRIRVYRNGDDNFFGKDFVLNPRQVRNYEAFLQRVTDHVQLNEAARVICTPVHGTRIRSLEDVQDRNDYVAVGHGKFKNIGYMTLYNKHVSKMQETKKSKEELYSNILPVQHSRIKVSGRIKKMRNEVTQIYVFSNGDEMTPAKRIVLSEQHMRSIGTVLAQINQYVNPQYGATRTLYDMDGRPVKSRFDIVNGRMYVAAGPFAAFKNVRYGAMKPVFDASPRIKTVESGLYNMTPRFPTDPPITRDSESFDVDNYPKSSQSYPLRTPRSRPFANARYRDDRLMTTNGEPLFHTRPVRHINRRPKPKIIDYDQDEGGIFKAKTRRSETQGARTIDDSRGMKTEIPIDLQEAEEVEDEQIEVEKKSKRTSHGNDSKQNGYRRISTKKKDKKNDRRAEINEFSDNESPTESQNNKDNDYDRYSRRSNSYKKSASKEENDENNDENVVDEVDVDLGRRSKIQNRKPTPHPSEDEISPPLERQGTTTLEETNNKETDKKREEAASKIQASFKGYKVRKTMPLKDKNDSEDG